MRAVLAAGAAVLCSLLLAVPIAAASPVATNDGAYAGLGRVFPDPLAGCQNSAGVCSPNANGNVPATQFIGIEEFIDGVLYMNQRSDWRNYMEVWALDGKIRDGSGNNGPTDVPGNNLDHSEFSPNKDFVSAGLPTNDLSRKKSDLMVVRVTDETVPDAGKKRYALSLSIHGIERAGAEGGTRAMEDLVTAYTTHIDGKPVVPPSVAPGAPTFADVLKKTIIYFTYPNPDGWRRGSVSAGLDGGVFFQRYNGNGVDPNRDWPDIGFAFRGYSAVSEPETKAWISFYKDVRERGGQFTAGDDLHGQPFADALSYTLLPHGRHKYGKNVRIQETAKAINRSTFDRIKWSPIVQSNDKPQGGGAPCTPTDVGDVCAKIYGQTWGSVYDTINYTTTGALGDWFDSAVGLNADGIDNEMSFSHLDKNINFDPHTEQLHVDGNKALIYAHLAQMLHPTGSASFDVGGRKAYVPTKRVKRGPIKSQPDRPEGSVTQDDIDFAAQPVLGSANFDFNVAFGPQPNGKNIFNGGMRVEATNQNAQGVATGMVTLSVQCKNCDEHPGVTDEDGYVTVAEDFNQSPLYLQAGVVATVNHPQAYGRNGKPVEWRAVVSGPAGLSKVQVHFTEGRASEDGDTGGGAPPEQRPYDVANTDFFKDLNPFIPGSRQDLHTLNPRRVIAGKQSLNNLDTIVLADDAMPGFTGALGGVVEGEVGPPTKDFDFHSESATVPGGPSDAPGTFEEKEFTIGPNDGDKSASIVVTWADGQTNDFDVDLYREDADGNRTLIDDSGEGPPTAREEVSITDPKPGKYVVHVRNYAAPDPSWQGTARFEALPNAGERPPSSYTDAQKETWFRKLRAWVRDGGNLVLTDAALRALPELTSIPAKAVSRQTVYAGQASFTKGEGDTLKDPLARGLDLPGARFNSGMRRQMYEPTPLGYSIQDAAGNDESHARQYDVDRGEWEKAGGRMVAGSADAGARDAKAVSTRVGIGEMKLGKGDIRIAGGLFPQPTEAYDHQFGLEPYATTYSGYIMARNLLEAINRSAPGTIGGRFVISRRAVKTTRKRVARVRVSCRTPLGCKGRLTLKVRKRAGRTKKGKRRYKLVTIGRSKRFSYKTRHRNAILRVKLNKKGRKIVLQQRRKKVRAVAPITFTDGRKGVARRRFWLYRPKLTAKERARLTR